MVSRRNQVGGIANTNTKLLKGAQNNETSASFVMQFWVPGRPWKINPLFIPSQTPGLQKQEIGLQIVCLFAICIFGYNDTIVINSQEAKFWRKKIITARGWLWISK